MSKFLNDQIVSKFMTRKWIKVNGSSDRKYSVNKNIRFEISVLRSKLSVSNANIVVKATITGEGTNENNQADKMLTFKNNAPFRSYMSKINNRFIESAEDLDIVMLMNNLLECSDNYSVTSRRFFVVELL